MNQVLSSEEVDAILNVSDEKGQDLSTLGSEAISEQAKQYSQALSNINELIRSEFEKNFSSFLRKKIIIKPKALNFALVSGFLSENNEKKVFSTFKIMPQEGYGLFMADASLVHYTLSLLYGGKINKDEPVVENSGKVGVIVSEKICQLFLTSFCQACLEYGKIQGEVIKTAPSLNLISNLHMENENHACSVEFSVFIDEIETTVKFIILEDFLAEFFPVKKEVKHREKDFWRTAIKSQVVDSFVTINMTLPEITMNVNDFLDLKEGDLIPIGDPTVAYVCLNSIKLFKAAAAQANSKRVVKIISQI